MFNQVVDRVLKGTWLQLVQVINHHHFGLIEIVRDEIWHIGLGIRFESPILRFSGVFLQPQRLAHLRSGCSGFLCNNERQRMHKKERRLLRQMEQLVEPSR